MWLCKLSGGCRRSQYPQGLKYWMPIQYDTIEDGQNKKLIIFYSLIEIHMQFFVCLSWCPLSYDSTSESSKNLETFRVYLPSLTLKHY